MTTTRARRALALRSTSVVREMVCGYRRGGRSLNSRIGDGACVCGETLWHCLSLMDFARDECATASPRDDTPSFRYTDIACVFTVFRDTYKRSAISRNERCVVRRGS